MPPFRMNKLQFKLYWFAKYVHVKLFGIPMNVFINDLDHCHIGKNVWLGPGVVIVSADHNLRNPEKLDEVEDVYIGDDCWLGTNVVITPGVTLGPHTVVGANSVVTKSFPEGNIVIAGCPAVKIKYNL